MKTASSMLLLAALTSSAFAADPASIDWSKINPTRIQLFYPGQSSYEWLRSDAHKGAVREVMRGDSCTSCHDEEDNEKDIGAKTVSGERLEPTPVKGKNGDVELAVQVAYDAQNAYFRFQWKTQQNKPGTDYPYYRFDGKEWKVYGAPQLDAPVRDGKQPPIYEDRMSMMIDDGKVPMFAQQGCWLTCHDGERDMPGVKGKEEVAKNPLMAALKKNDVRKYLPATRDNPANWTSGKSIEEIAKIKAEGGFVDLIQWRANRSNPIGYADDGYVLEYRNFDTGKNPFASNMDNATKQPKLMFDAAKFGAKAVTVAQVGKQDNLLTKGVNALPFDPNAGWKDGDLLPRYYLAPGDVSGSAADNKALGKWANGMWTVVLTRPLNLANDDDKALKEGGVYNVGFAVHDDNITTRGHFVSWNRTVGFGKKADIEAVKLP